VTPDSCWPTTSGEQAGAFPSALPATSNGKVRGRANMASSKDIQAAKKVCASHRQFFKELLDHLYAQAAEAGRYPSPERMIFDQLLPLVEVAILRDQPPQPPDQDFTDLQVRLGLRIYRQLFDDAVAAYFRHRPGLEIKGKPGRKAEIELAERIWKLKAEGKTVPEMQAIFRAEGQHFSKEKIESYLKTRRKKPQQ